MVRLILDSLRLAAGEDVSIPPCGVVCIVGGNNVGKSTFLRELLEIIEGSTLQRVVVQSGSWHFSHSTGDVVEWLRTNSHRERSGSEGYLHPLQGGSGVGEGNLRFWREADAFEGTSPDVTSSVAHWFVRNLDAGSRASIATAGHSSTGGMVGQPRSAIDELYRNGDLEAEISAVSERVFGTRLTLDRLNPDFRLRVGEPDVDSPPLARPTKEYAEALERLPLLSEQGDGVKMYLGMVLHSMTGRESVTIFDEPEAFLHPAQARALGRHLGEQAVRAKRQVFCATHDRDFVLGLLRSGAQVVFVRLDRTGTDANAALLPSQAVRRVWDSPQLRYSNLLQGIFHRAAVICEGDADCRWYQAALDSLAEQGNQDPNEILFVPAGSKQQAVKSAVVLRSLGVRTFCLVDFDFVLGMVNIPDIRQLLGERADQVMASSKILDAHVPAGAIRDRAKGAGLAGVPPGDATRAAQSILAELRDCDVMVLTTGELESLDRAVGGHGPAWVDATLEAGTHSRETAATPLLTHILTEVLPRTRPDQDTTS